MKRLLICLSFIIYHLSFCYAQNIAQDINKIKRDTMYISAEATMKDLNEAYSGARAILEIAGVKDVVSKSLGSNTKVNVAKATLEALQSERTPEQIAELRGKKVEEL